MGTADGEILVELNFIRLLLLQMVTGATKTERVRLNRWTFNITDLDRQVKCVLLGLERAEQGEDVADFVRA